MSDVDIDRQEGRRGTGARRLRLPAAAGRAGWNLVDQVISSGTNAVLSFLVARSVTETDFGGFAVAFTVFSLLVGLSRAVSTSPLGIRFSSAEPGAFRGAAGAAVGTAFVLGALAGAGCLAAGALVGGTTREALLALGILFPGLLVQDAWRLTFFAQARPAAAALNDAFWAVVQLTAVGALLLGGVSTVGPLVLAWGGSAAAAALLGIRQARVRPRPRATGSWLRDHRDLTRVLAAEFATLQGSHQGALLLIAAIGSLATIGALRGAQVLLGPTTILAVGMFTFALPEFSRRRDSLRPRHWMLGGIGLSAVIGVVGLAWGVLFLLAPDGVGEALLGDSWVGTRAVLLASVVGQFGAAMSMGPSTMLYAMDRAPVTFRIHVAMGVLLVTLGVGGVTLAGAQGAAWGISAAFWAVLPAWWRSLRREARARAAGA